jgi:1-aminocyclopropane-1-carboxylate deaminase/D-cysteine desulfhydrase-like pyridoxal-dependent ACC family enzyme
VGWRELEVAVERAGEAARAAGRGPVLAPVGCSSPLGALGFAAAFLELHEQCRAAGVEPAAIVHASSSAGTHAGLLVGRALARVDTPVIGIDVAAITEDPTVAAAELARSAAALIGVRLQNPGADIRSDFLGPGYGTPDRRTAEAVHVFAALEAIITDPVYSGKGAAGALALAREHDGPVVFWHTGGYHALFDPAHAQALAAASRGLESGHRAD